MREKLQKLMHIEGLTSSRLAEILEIQPSGISHLLAGRNKPGFDLLQKMLRRFPQINPDWLLLDSEDMYRKDAAITASSMDATRQISQNESLSTSEPSLPLNSDSPQGHQTDGNATGTEPVVPVRLHGNIVRIVVFYDNHTFESYLSK